MISPLLVILILLFSSYVVGEAFKKLGLPRVVGQIVVGLLFGVQAIKSILLYENNLEILSFLANLGAILLFYYIGLETNFKEFKKNLKMSFLISVFNTLFPLVLGFLTAKYILNLDTLTSVIIGSCLAVSAQSVSADILEELKLLKSKIGTMIISAGTVDDTVELLLVSGILTILQVSFTHKDISNFILGISLFFMIMILSRIWIIPFMLKFFEREKSQTARFTGSLLIVLLIASISEFFGLGALIGAMIAGMIVRQTIFKDLEIPRYEEHQMATSVHLIAYGFLIPLFFLWVGTNTDLSIVAHNYLLILGLTLIAIIGTVGGTVLAVILTGGSLTKAILLGWGLTPKGDVELIMAASALKMGIISPEIFTTLVMMSLCATIISPIIFKKLVLKYGPAVEKE